MNRFIPSRSKRELKLIRRPKCAPLILKYVSTCASKYRIEPLHAFDFDNNGFLYEEIKPVLANIPPLYKTGKISWRSN